MLRYCCKFQLQSTFSHLETRDHLPNSRFEGYEKPEHEDLTVIVSTWNVKLTGEAELFDKTKPIDVYIEQNTGIVVKQIRYQRSRYAALDEQNFRRPFKTPASFSKSMWSL